MPPKKTRKAREERKSTETEIKVELNVDGSGKSKLQTPIGILNHMLELFTFHGLFDLNLQVKGDTHIDIHHTNEDIGIVLGKAFKKALGDMKGIRRFGSGFSPMESTLGHCVIDISGRGYFSDLQFQGQAPGLLNSGFNIGDFVKNQSQHGYSFEYVKHFLESFAHNLGATIFMTIQNPSGDLHTNIETVFKSLGLALDQATQIDPRRKGVPSTKGIID